MIESCSGPFSYRDLIWDRKIFLSHRGVLHRGKELGNERIIVMVLKNIIFVPYYWIMLNWYAAHVDKYTEEQRYAMLKKIDHAANRGGNLHIDGHGVENIPSQNGFMFYPNHQGLYDVLAIMEVCPVPFQ